ncbi:unnamed protein product [Linum tenue]|uniref:Uncharacterized protein n=1 Tax=Linum tenue TaxID=586396 RepID=A0AAV0K8C8_9ROSI|nr:unnamed protein product [Linum tenue]
MLEPTVSCLTARQLRPTSPSTGSISLILCLTADSPMAALSPTKLVRSS